MNSKPCSICGAASSIGDKCAEHAAKWQRRFFYPCNYCGGHVKSYKAKRCRRPACISKAMKEVAARRFPNRKAVTPQRRHTHAGITSTACGWARRLGRSPALITYHLSRGKSISEIIARFTKKGGKNAR